MISLMMDLIFVRDVTSQMHTFLSQIDDGTTNQVVDLAGQPNF